WSSDVCSSDLSTRTGAVNSASARTAANGLLPDPFASRRTPWWNSQLPSSSTAYHHRRNRTWLSTNVQRWPARGPFGWRRYLRAQPITSKPRVNSGMPEGIVISRSAGEASAPLIDLSDRSLLVRVALRGPLQFDPQPAPVPLRGGQRTEAGQDRRQHVRGRTLLEPLDRASDDQRRRPVRIRVELRLA